MRKERGLRVARVRVQDVTNNEQMRAGHQDYVTWHPEDARALGIKESSSLTPGSACRGRARKERASVCLLNEVMTAEKRGKLGRGHLVP